MSQLTVTAEVWVYGQYRGQKPFQRSLSSGPADGLAPALRAGQRMPSGEYGFHWSIQWRRSRPRSGAGTALLWIPPICLRDAFRIASSVLPCFPMSPTSPFPQHKAAQRVGTQCRILKISGCLERECHLTITRHPPVSCTLHPKTLFPDFKTLQ